jgi:glycosyltransferase involved in cell wall biosynthesis
MLGPGDGSYRTLAMFPTRLKRELNAAPEDILHLHWIGGEMISVRQIARLTKPVVWTLHDEWAMRGAEHIATWPDAERWRSGYRCDNRPTVGSGLDLDSWVWNRKRKAWKRPMTAICPSRWLASRTADSLLLRDWRIEVIPNPIDTDTWHPRPRAEARARLGLSTEEPLVVFGAIGGTSDPNKGADLLRISLKRLAATRNRPFRLGIFGQSAPAPGERWCAPATYFGFMARPEQLMDVYAAADVVVVPSRAENLPNIAVEAQCCGRPVVAFATGGVPECVSDGKTGHLAPPFDTERLAAGIARVIDNASHGRMLGEAARHHAEQNYSSRRLVPRFIALYRELLDDRAGGWQPSA